MKRLFILICCIQLFNFCNSQSNHNFDIFLNKFARVNYPVTPQEVFHSYAREWEHYILEDDFNTYLKTSSDSIWRFDEEHQFVYGGKFNVNPNITCVFYRRVYFAENVDDQISEVVLSTFNQKGNNLSNMPIAGGYGDSLTFSSVIRSTQKIEVNYKKFSEENIEEMTKYFVIRSTGEIVTY